MCHSRSSVFIIIVSWTVVPPSTSRPSSEPHCFHLSHTVVTSGDLYISFAHFSPFHLSHTVVTCGDLYISFAHFSPFHLSHTVVTSANIYTSFAHFSTFDVSHTVVTFADLYTNFAHFSTFDVSHTHCGHICRFIHQFRSFFRPSI